VGKGRAGKCYVWLLERFERAYAEGGLNWSFTLDCYLLAAFGLLMWL
jgi:hypothetical protein